MSPAQTRSQGPEPAAHGSNGPGSCWGQHWRRKEGPGQPPGSGEKGCMVPRPHWRPRPQTGAGPSSTRQSPSVKAAAQLPEAKGSPGVQEQPCIRLICLRQESWHQRAGHLHRPWPSPPLWGEQGAAELLWPHRRGSLLAAQHCSDHRLATGRRRWGSSPLRDRPGKTLGAALPG